MRLHSLQMGSGFVNVEGRQSPARQGAGGVLQLYEPAVTASWRLRLLRKGNVPDEELKNVK
jgi:hypothetical protein